MKYYFYVFLCILFNTVLAMTYRLVSRRQCSPQGTLTVAYCVAFITAIGGLFVQGYETFKISSILIGFVAGMMVFLAGFSFMRAVNYGKLSLSWTIRTLAVVIPIGVSIVFWHEQLNWRKCIGFCSLVMCVILVGAERNIG